MRITIVGMGYVGLSLATLLSQENEVSAVEIDKLKIDKINKRISPINDKDIKFYFDNKILNLNASDSINSYESADYVIVATPTDYNIKNSSFNTKSVEKTIADCLRLNSSATIVIKSTIPIGFTDKMREKFKTSNIIFSPEFLRESKALYDNLYPSRIIIGDYSEKAKSFGKMLTKNAVKKNIPLFYMDSREAEAVKLFSNTFLAMRVSFFNELDSFSETEKLESKKIIEGVSTDPRIGNYYNNPSFGYGGYCLPKDTKQLLNNFNKIPNKLIKAVVESNSTRKGFIVSSILDKSPKSVGIYRLIMKKNSENFRESATIDIVKMLKKEKIKLFIFEPNISDRFFEEIPIITEISEFIEMSELIIANRYSSQLDHVINKVYTRDLFKEN